MKRRVIIFFIFASLLLLLTACITDEIENKDIVFMNGEVLIELEAHDEFEDPGITMPDNFTLIRNENINIDRIGSYEIHYKVLDNEGVVYKEMIRVINVYDFTAPEIIVSNNCVINLGIDEGLSSCFDLSDNYYSIEELVVDISVEDFNSANLTGSYIVNISATDPSDNNATTSFNVEIVLDYFEIIQHLTTYSNDILSITYDEAGGPYQKPSYWINFLSGDRLNISSDEDFYYVMRYSTEMFSGLLFFLWKF